MTQVDLIKAGVQPPAEPEPRAQSMDGLLYSRSTCFSLPGNGAPDAARHRASHRSMAIEVLPPDDVTAEAVERESLDLIVMPSARSFERDPVGLDLAIAIADKFSAQLVVICSKEAKVDEFPWDYTTRMGLDERGLRPVVLDFAAASAALPSSISARTPIARFRRPNDTGPKRNLGLIIAKQRRARNVLFLDDDITPMPMGAGPTLTSRSLGYAIRQLAASPSLRAIGFTASDQADNSVVCHVRRLLKYSQDIFLGAGALLVKMTDDIPHFPVSMYNEDWLFMMYLCANSPNYKEALGWAGDVHQSASPRYSAERAWSEEPGDLIGEALMNLLENQGPGFLASADEKFWNNAIKARLSMISRLRSRLRTTVLGDGDELDHALGIDALRTATSAYGLINERHVCEYLARVQEDQKCWSALLNEIAPLTAQ